MTMRVRDGGIISVPLDDSMVSRAYELAVDAHAGQVDKAGEDYIGHPLAVARSMSSVAPN